MRGPKYIVMTTAGLSVLLAASFSAGACRAALPPDAPSLVQGNLSGGSAPLPRGDDVLALKGTGESIAGKADTPPGKKASH